MFNVTLTFYVGIFLGGHNGYLVYQELEFWYATYPDLDLLNLLELPLGHTLVWGKGSLFMFAFKFTLIFTSAFLFEVITWIPFKLGS